MTTDVSPGTLHREYLLGQLADKQYRDRFVDATIRNNVAAQIRGTRSAHGWSQKHLADLCDTRQSVISQLEDPDYGRHSLSSLRRLASAFDCALDVRFVPFSTLLNRAVGLDDSEFIVSAFDDDTGLQDHHEVSMLDLLAERSTPLPGVFRRTRISTAAYRDDPSTFEMPFPVQSVQTELPGDFTRRAAGLTMLTDYLPQRLGDRFDYNDTATLSMGDRYAAGS
jgi:transcriptional regulator with XRE-family HTH domain